MMNLLITTLLSLCAAAEPLVKPGNRVLVFGDSISTGKCYGYVAVELLNKEYPSLKLTWLEHGHPGWTAKHAATILDKVLEDKPTLVTIMFGTNDLGYEGAKGVGEIKDRIRALAEPLLKANVRVALLTTPYIGNVGAYAQELNRSALPRMGEDIVALGRELKVPVFDMYAFMKQADAEGRARDPEFLMFNTPGDCHPNGPGHKLMGRALADFLLGQSKIVHRPFAWTYAGKPEATAAFAEKPADVSAVKGVEPMVLDRKDQMGEPERWKGPADLSAKAWAGWDKTALYLTVEVTDDVVLASEKQPAWDYDGIEFFFDTRPREQRDVAYAPGYFQMLVSVPKADGPAPVCCGNMDKLDAAAATATCKRTAGGYRLDITVPWEQLRFTPEDGVDVGFDFAINDKDQPDKPRYKALWRGAGDDYANAGATGVLRLERQ